MSKTQLVRYKYRALNIFTDLGLRSVNLGIFTGNSRDKSTKLSAFDPNVRRDLIIVGCNFNGQPKSQ